MGDSGGTSKPGWASGLKVYIEQKNEEQGWRRLARQIAERVPSEVDYVYSTWTHEKIAWEYILLLYNQGLQMDSDS